MKSQHSCCFFGASLGILSIFMVACQQHAPVPDEVRSDDLAHLLKDPVLQDLGKKIFFDTTLSTPPGESCAECHSPEVGWTGPQEALNKEGSVYRGAIRSRFGNRKPNSSAYATFAPPFHAEYDGNEMLFVGGNFWDGRASGWKLGNAAADQAQGPFLNPVEQNNPEASTVIAAICRSPYAAEFKAVAKKTWGIDDVGAENAQFVYGIVALAIAAFEHSPGMNTFSSKYDWYLKGKAELTADEKKGLELFGGKAKCARCHPGHPDSDGTPPLFTDFTYDNIGIPKNPDNPWYRMPVEFNPQGSAWIDPGLAGFLKDLPQYAMYAKESLGKFRVPTLRNVDLRPRPSFVKAYGHNGYFKSLEGIVHFYNTRDVLPSASLVSNPEPGINCWPPPEVSENKNTEELGTLGLTPEEEGAIVAFMKTLSDGYPSP
jgi:cytochrome c peroxidase